MYVWMIGKAIPTKKNNMYGSFEFEQALMLVRHGIKVVYIGLDFRPLNQLRKWGMRQLRKGDLVAYEYSLPIRPLPFIQRKVELFFCRKLYRKIEDIYGLPDVIHVHFPAILNAPIHAEYKKRGVKIAATEHWTQVLKRKLSKKYLENLSWFAHHADTMICVSEPLKKSVLALTCTRNNIEVVPNIINHEFQYVPQEAKDKFTFVGVGRLVSCKRFDLMINAFTKAFWGNNSVELLIIGDGEEYTNLKKQIENLGMKKSIRLLGVLSRAETAKEVQKSDALICASNLETFGVPVIEAWACGKPVIGTDALGFLEYMNKNLGIIVETNNQEQMIEAMKELYYKRNEFNGKQISDFAMKHFSETAIFAKLYNIYRNMIDG